MARSPATEAPEWQVETVRLTTFVMPGVTETPLRWSGIFHAEPDEVVRQGGNNVESGIVDGTRWMTAAQVNRFDIVASPPTPAGPPLEVVHIGPLQPNIDMLMAAARRGLPPALPIQRIAIGAVLSFPTETIRSGTDILLNIVRVLRDVPPGATEILLNLNVPFTVREPFEIEVNRIAKWQVATVQMVGMQPGIGGLLQFSTAAQRPYVRLELDVNTLAERPNQLPAEHIQALIQRLSVLTTDIARTGEFSE